MLSLVSLGNEIRTYAIEPEFIDFLLSHEINRETASISSKDPFADPAECVPLIQLSNLKSSQAPFSRETYLTRIRTPQQEDQFSPLDRVYDIRLLLKKFDVETQLNGWTLYNATQKKLVCYHLKEHNAKLLENISKIHSKSALQLLNSTQKIAKPNSSEYGPPTMVHIKAPRDLPNFILDSSFYITSNNDPFADDFYPKGAELLFQHYDFLTKKNPVNPPVITGISCQQDICIDITKELETSGLVFREKEWAIYNYTSAYVIAYCSAQTSELIEQLVTPLCGGCRPTNIEISALLVTTNKTETILSYQGLLKSNHTVLTSFDATMRSGEQSKIGAHEHTSYCQFETTLGDNGYNLDLRIALDTPQIKYKAAFSLLDQEPTATLLYSDAQNSTYLLIQGSILRNRHSH
ncbi:MAG: hypothetical protein ACSHX2_07830 [Rubritalea sp.]